MVSCGEGGSTGIEIVTAINENTEGVATLEELSGTLQFDNRINTLDIPETPTIVAELDIPNLVAGTYIIGYSYTYEYDNAINSVITDFELNGETDRFSSEPSDISDRVADSYNFPYVQVADGPMLLRLYLSKSAAVGILNSHWSNLVIERKL